MHGFITRGKMHHSPEESSETLLESHTEKRVTFNFVRPRQGNQTFIRKTSVTKRVQETRHHLPQTEPNGSKIVHLMSHVKTDRWFHSVRWIEKPNTKKRRPRMRNERCLCGVSKHQRSESRWPSDLFISRCPTKDEKWTFRHALFGDRHKSKIEQGSINR